MPSGTPTASPPAWLARAHPETLIGQPVEANVFDPENPYVLGPHLCAAAAESPLTEADLEGVESLLSSTLDEEVRGLATTSAGSDHLPRRRLREATELTIGGIS